MSEVKTIPVPDLPDAMEAVKRDVKVNLNAVNIGQIKEFNPTKQTASIQIQLQQVTSIAPDGSRTIKEHPLILECPVVTMFGGDSFMNFPIKPGDTCLVFFNDREIDNWLVNGGLQVPTTQRTHDISDAIALVGIRHYQNSIAQFLANGIRISFAADSRIDLTEEAIDSIADMFTHTGNMTITENLRVQGNFYVAGQMYGENGTGGDTVTVATNFIQQPGFTLAAGNGVTGSFNVVNVLNGIVVGGS